MQSKLFGTVGVGFDVAGQVFIICPEFANHLIKNGNRLHQLFMDLENACDSVREQVLCNIVIDFGIPMKLVRLIKI
jgi:hypothetical protein